MNEILSILTKISLIVFMAGNLLMMGLKLNPKDAVRGLQNFHFVAYTLLWGFVLGPALAYGITEVIPLEQNYAIGLLLMGMAPCAPFLPMLVKKANGDPGYTASFMLLVAVVTVIYMPFAVPVMVKGLTVSAWDIARPLLVVVILPMATGMAILYASSAFAARLEPIVKKITQIFTFALIILTGIMYGKEMLGVAGNLAIASQLIFFFILAAFSYLLGFGLKNNQKVVLSIGMTTRNIGIALVPLISVAGIDQRSTTMVVLGFPIMTIAAMLAAKWFTHTTKKQED
jgi:BASS family bile acid:Na+ symporter